jgi:hypothetical protein
MYPIYIAWSLVQESPQFIITFRIWIQTRLWACSTNTGEQNTRETMKSMYSV